MPHLSKKLVGYAGIIFILILIGLPLYWTIIGSLKTHGEIYSKPVTWYPHDVYVQNYDDATNRVPFYHYFRNSVIITVILCVIKISLGVVSAYALSVLKFPGRNLVFIIVISALMVPSEITQISNYALVSNLGWRNTFQGIIVPLPAQGTHRSRPHGWCQLHAVVVQGPAANLRAHTGGVLRHHRGQRMEPVPVAVPHGGHRQGRPTAGRPDTAAKQRRRDQLGASHGRHVADHAPDHCPVHLPAEVHDQGPDHGRGKGVIGTVM